MNPLKWFWDVCYRQADAIVSRFDVRLPTKYVMEDISAIPLEGIHVFEGEDGQLRVELSGKALEVAKENADMRKTGIGEAFRYALGDYGFFVKNGGNFRRTFTSKPRGPFGIGKETRDFIVP